MAGSLRIFALVLFLVGLLGLPAASAPAPVSIARYLEIRSASAPHISPDGTQVAYLSNASGTSQVWVVQSAGGTPRQLTQYDDRVTFVDWSPDGRTLVFGKDTKGNERTQLHLLDLASGRVTDLTRAPEVIHKFGGWSPNSRFLAWASNARKTAFFDVYVHDLERGETRQVRQADESISVAAWSPNGDALVLRRDVSNLASELLLLDLEHGRTRVLTAPVGEADYSSVCWPRGGRTIFLVTNQDHEFARLAALDADSGRLTFLGTRTSWDVTDLTMNADGRQAAWVTNENGVSRLRFGVLDRLDDARLIDLPAGVLTGLSLSDDGQRAAFGWTAPRTPSSIYVAADQGRTVLPLVVPKLDGIDAASLVEPAMITYPTFDGRAIPAIFYRPRGDARAPVVVSVHGGPEGQERPVWSGFYQYLAACGYGVLAPNIRGSVGYGKTYTHLDDVALRGDAIEDVARAAAWLRSQSDVDGTHLAVMGGSYGGYMTLAQVAFHPDLFAAAVDIVGISNFETFLANTGAWRRKYRIAEYGDPERDREVLRRFSPIHKVADIRTPLMVIQGAQDPRVPKSEADQMVASLRARGQTVIYLVFDNEGHGLSKLSNRIEAYTVLTRFLDTCLRGNPPERVPSR